MPSTSQVSFAAPLVLTVGVETKGCYTVPPEGSEHPSEPKLSDTLQPSIHSIHKNFDSDNSAIIFFSDKRVLVFIFFIIYLNCKWVSTR
jgi:hypothetical protein